MQSTKQVLMFRKYYPSLQHAIEMEFNDQDKEFGYQPNREVQDEKRIWDDVKDNGFNDRVLLKVSKLLSKAMDIERAGVFSVDKLAHMSKLRRKHRSKRMIKLIFKVRRVLNRDMLEQMKAFNKRVELNQQIRNNAKGNKPAKKGQADTSNTKSKATA